MWAVSVEWGLVVPVKGQNAKSAGSFPTSMFSAQRGFGLNPFLV